MITINDHNFYEEPGSCGTCPFLFIPGKNAPSFLPSGGCRKIFRKAFTYPDGYKLVIVAKE